MEKNKRLYTCEPDFTISTWYLFGWYGPRFAVSPVRNAKLRDFKRYYHMNDIGKCIFLTRTEALAAGPMQYKFALKEGETV